MMALLRRLNHEQPTVREQAHRSGTGLARASPDEGTQGDTMDRRRIEWQIDAVLVPFRREQTRQAHSTMNEFRARAHSILDGLEEDARRYPDLQARLAEARRELDSQ